MALDWFPYQRRCFGREYFWKCGERKLEKYKKHRSEKTDKDSHPMEIGEYKVILVETNLSGAVLRALSCNFSRHW